MTYAEITFQDRNAVKRWLQRRRLSTAARMARVVKSEPACVLDFGAGNGELCKLLATQYPTADIICYEPVEDLMIEARDNVAHVPRIGFCRDIGQVPDRSVDLLFCLEVLEHLPQVETAEALRHMDRIMKDGAHAVIGVPIEIGIPAVYKGVFRMFRRFGAFDASVKNILLALFCSPPKQRPVSEVAPGFFFHHLHMGFDYRDLRLFLSSRFKLSKISTSPLPILGRWINAEVNFLIVKK